MAMRLSGLIGSVQHGAQLAPEQGDPGFVQKIRHFMDDMELAIQEANREVLGHALPDLDREAFLRLAVRVAELRAQYLKLGLSLATGHPDSARIRELADARQAYEEMLKLFESAERVVERGYIRLADR
ncbi:MAG: hypothetical protein RLY86_3810 [Pseudomonadota bacterium]|jgi:hypothetical protein